MATERWLPVPTHPAYEVSDHGRVRRINDRRKNPRALSPDRSYPTAQRNRTRPPYLRVALSVDGKKRKYCVHRLVAAAFIGPCPEGHQVNHKDGDKSHNRPENLEYVTLLENMRHATHVLKRQMGQRGSDHYSAILTDADVIQIRHLRAGGMKLQQIAERFNTIKQNISMICTGKQWKHLLP